MRVKGRIERARQEGDGAGYERAREAAIALVEHEVKLSHVSQSKDTLGGIITDHLRIELQIFEKRRPR
jgi:hypothetical protein